MFIGVVGTYKGFTLFLSPESLWQSLLMILVSAGVGVVIYGYLALKSRLVNLLFGEKVDRLKEKLHLRI